MIVGRGPIPRKGRTPQSVWKLGLVGLLGLVGCQTIVDRVPPPRAHAWPERVEGAARNTPERERASEGVRLAAFPPLADDARTCELSEAAILDLGVALRLAGVENPTINLAREAIREAQAEQLAAQAMLLPTIHVGGNFNLHRGALQPASGAIRDVDRQSLYLGAGALAVGSGTIAFPGVRLFAPLGDAAYEPLAARQRVTARSGTAQAVQNDILLAVAAAYLNLIGAEERVRLLQQSEADLGEVVRLTGAYARTGQGRSADAHRAVANFQLLARETQVAEEDRAVASARLAQLLNLDPAVRLRTPPGAVPLIRLIPADATVAALLEMALRGRPEIVARSAEVGLSQVRRRQEVVRPFLPIVSVGFSGGAFGGGNNRPGPEFGPLEGRTDFDVAAIWHLDGFGFGNRFRVRRAEALVGQAIAAREQTRTEIRQQVAEAHAQIQAAHQQLETALAAVPVAEQGFHLETLRIKQGQGLPIEVLDSFRQLLDARLEVLRTIVAFDIAQFRLHAAIGNTPAAPTAASAPPP